MGVHAEFDGGCLCGAIRYRAVNPGENVSHCHCEHCQRSSGGAFVTWVPLRRQDLVWTRGVPKQYRHDSDWPTPITRTFCDRCGSSLTYERDGEPYLDITAVSLDEPDSVVPQRHVYVSRQRAWIHVNDGLPRNSTLPSRDDNTITD